ncbi:transposable element Tc1 transposase [Trichonephila clavipes]|nr:transposable element Tc1 transposase [Trichonephila clavipes]
MPSRRLRRPYRQLNDFEHGRFDRIREAEYLFTTICGTFHHFTALAEAGLRSQRPLRCLSLTPQHRQNRLEGCRRRSSWLSSDWRCILFSNKSRFTPEADDHCLRVWRGQGQLSQSDFVLQRHIAITPGVIV